MSKNFQASSRKDRRGETLWEVGAVAVICIYLEFLFWSLKVGITEREIHEKAKEILMEMGEFFQIQVCSLKNIVVSSSLIFFCYAVNTVLENPLVTK